MTKNISHIHQASRMLNILENKIKGRTKDVKELELFKHPEKVKKLNEIIGGDKVN